MKRLGECDNHFCVFGLKNIIEEVVVSSIGVKLGILLGILSKVFGFSKTELAYF